MMKIDIQSLLETFFEEADEHLVAFEQGLLELDSDPSNEEVIARIFRAAHSIKGASGTFGLNDILSFTHALETLFDRLRQHELPYDAVLGRALLGALDMLKVLVDAARTGAPAPAEMEAVKRSVLSFVPGVETAGDAGDHVADSASASRRVRVRFSPRPTFMTRGMDPLRIVRDVRLSGTVETCELDAAAVPSLDELDPTEMFLSWNLVIATDTSLDDLREIFSFVDDLCTFEVEDLAVEEVIEKAVVATATATATAAAPRAGQAPGASAEAPTIRVATDKIDMLLDLVGELVIAHAMIVQASRANEEDSAARLAEALSSMERHTRDLQERVMSIRMVPLATVFRRFPRLVHDTAAAVGKTVRLEVHGEGTEIDKSMVEKLVDPLTHLVRNAIDHGLEPPHERAEAGKSEEGTVTITARHQGGNVVIEVADDGRGLDTARIRAKAERLGMIAPGAVVPDEQLHELIFAAGFSTAAAVSDLSGRGVGMDVVKRNVELLNGSLSLETERGRGTRMRMKLPLTLAILDGLSVRVGQQTFIVPLLSVIESFRPIPGQVRGIFGRPEVIDVRGASLPIVWMRDILGVPDGEADACKAIVCIVETNEGNVAMIVDELLGQLQVVVKSLEVNYQKVGAVMGATIMGNGQVAMIVDVQALGRATPRAANDHSLRHSDHVKGV